MDDFNIFFLYVYFYIIDDYVNITMVEESCLFKLYLTISDSSHSFKKI